MTYYFVYLLITADKKPSKTYVGWTTDLDKRLKQHNEDGGAKSTRGRVWALLYAERCSTRHDAMSREWHLKRDRRFRKELAGKISRG